MKGSNWYCVDRECGAVLGTVEGRELFIRDKLIDVRTDGPNLVVTCPECGRKKTYYTSDKVVRAVYELLDTLVTLFVTRSMRKLSRETVAMMAKLEEDSKNV